MRLALRVAGRPRGDRAPAHHHDHRRRFQLCARSRLHHPPGCRAPSSQRAVSRPPSAPCWSLCVRRWPGRGERKIWSSPAATTAAMWSSPATARAAIPRRSPWSAICSPWRTARAALRFPPPRRIVGAEFEVPHYIRFLVNDRPGIVAAITAALANEQINIRAIVQKPGYPAARAALRGHRRALQVLRAAARSGAGPRYGLHAGRAPRSADAGVETGTATPPESFESLTRRPQIRIEI